MKYLLCNYYNLSVPIGIAILLFTFIDWNNLNYLSAFSLLNLAALNFHFFEEFGFPGGFPYFANTMFAMKNSPRPDRYPINQMVCFLTNWGTALVLYVPPIFFPDKIWLGLAPVIFGLLQIVGHGIMNNIMLKTWYNGGLAAALFGHLPVGIFYIKYIVENNLATSWDWAIGTAIVPIWYILGVRILIAKTLKDINSPYPFDKVEMDKFHTAYKHLPYKK